MTRVIVAILVGLMFLGWLVIMLPGWIMGMMMMGQVRIVPGGPMDAGFWAFVAAMYLPPLLAAATLAWLVKTRRKTRMPADTNNKPGAAA